MFDFPDPRIAHGCMIEAALLAFEGRYEGFSNGRGNITADKIDEMWSLACRHGIQVAPLFNRDGVWR
jgi:fatty aldehyde-generating acyl-ACP reductase